MHELIKAAHVGCVILSIIGFITSWVLNQAGSKTLYKRPVFRWLIHVVDSLLVLLGGWLVWSAGIALATGWLVAKLVLMMCYIVLGRIALWGRGYGVRPAAFVLAMMCIGIIVWLVHTKPYLVI